MKVVIYGGNGMLGPHVVKALEGRVSLRITDLEPFETSHEMMPVDVADPEAVLRAAEGMDVIINLSVLRPHRKIAFDVNTLGCYNVMRAAVRNGIRRVINTGPYFTVQGDPYMHWDYHIGPDVPPGPERVCMCCPRDWARKSAGSSPRTSTCTCCVTCSGVFAVTTRPRNRFRTGHSL
jgi:nucleoside-diphosphate-sugar epimerase